MLKIKRVYQEKGAADGTRILVDRLWPRGLSKAQAAIDEWMKEVAPGDELRRRFAHRPERWQEFREKYTAELSAPEKAGLLEKIARMAKEGEVTLVYAARDSEHNNARVLEKVIAGMMKDPQLEWGEKCPRYLRD